MERRGSTTTAGSTYGTSAARDSAMPRRRVSFQLRRNVREGTFEEATRKVGLPCVEWAPSATVHKLHATLLHPLGLHAWHLTYQWWCSETSCCSSGWKSRRRNTQFGAVVISGRHAG